QTRRASAAADPPGRPPRPARRPAGPRRPVVIWNLTRRCNLTCKHCYAASADHAYPGELTPDEMLAVLADLKAYGVPALILSGGEPLLAPALWPVAERARELGFHLGLSTNGTLIDEAMARRIADHGFDYVGISLDGLRATHDRFRRQEGAFDASVAALRRLRERGVSVGLRYTMTDLNGHDFPALLDLARAEGAGKFYFSHLNYAGRGDIHRARDARFQATRAAMQRLFEVAWQAAWRGEPVEYVSGNNDADGVFLHRWAAARWPRWQAPLRERLVAWGGNASGIGVANIDNLGHVHPDTMWWHHDLGGVRERPFSAIWEDTSDRLLAGLRRVPRPLKGRCGACPAADICGGNTRVRAHRVSGDPWAEDPGCYLEDDELGLWPAREVLHETA
uniref:heme d1 biosynthesis radical SAM protein NirJ n=1 Tax=Ramlibacter sp. TaxID=1917967 RepID=UPI0035B4303F